MIEILLRSHPSPQFFVRHVARVVVWHRHAARDGVGLSRLPLPVRPRQIIPVDDRVFLGREDRRVHLDFDLGLNALRVMPMPRTIA